MKPYPSGIKLSIHCLKQGLLLMTEPDAFVRLDNKEDDCARAAHVLVPRAVVQCGEPATSAPARPEATGRHEVLSFIGFSI